MNARGRIIVCVAVAILVPELGGCGGGSVPDSIDENLTPTQVASAVERYVESDSKRPPYIDGDNSVANRFARAYEQMLRGETILASQEFELLAEADDSFVWGAIGLLEHAVYTGNECALERRLRRFNLPNVSRAPYEFQLALSGTRYADALAAFEKIEDPADWQFSGAVTAAIRQGDEILADALLQTAREKFGLTAPVLVVTSAIRAARGGDNAAIELLSQHVRDDASDWEVRNTLFFLTAELQDDEVVLERQLLSIAFEKHHDVRVLATAAQFALEFGLHSAVGRLLTSINSRSRPPADIVAYRLLLAKIDYLEGDRHSLHLNLNAAFDMAPYDYWVNWFRYQLAQEGSDSETALDALSRLRKVDEHDPSVLVELFEFYQSAGNEDEARRISDSIQQSGRYISDAIRERLSDAAGPAT